jgi:short-subunit dehydrogenase
MSRTNVSPQTILITGASRGIGKQLALRYAAEHINLILIARNRDQLLEVAQHCQDLGANTIYKVIDVTDSCPLKNFILEIDEELPIDLVIANAGVSSTLQSNWRQETDENIQNVLAINLQGTMNTINPLIHRMISRQKGQIALMSSLAGLRGLPQSPSYCASKAALYIYGQSLRAWLNRYNIKVNVICPGYVKTDMSDRLSGPKHFLVSSEKAVRIIEQGLRRDKACIAFPWQLNWLTRLSSILPSKPVNFILNRYESYLKD